MKNSRIRNSRNFREFKNSEFRNFEEFRNSEFRNFEEFRDPEFRKSISEVGNPWEFSKHFFFIFFLTSIKRFSLTKELHLYYYWKHKKKSLISLDHLHHNLRNAGTNFIFLQEKTTNTVVNYEG